MPADFNFLTQMRRIGFLFSFVAFMMISCAKETVTVTGDSAGPMGEVTIALASVDGHHNALPVKSTVEVPDAGDFKIEIFNAEGVRLYRDTYANSENKKIPLNAGEYRLLASHGKALGVGFDAIYFAADRNFTVRPQTAETIEATARMANVKVAVNFGENLDTYYAGHYARVKNPQVQDYLQFDQDETRAGYIPAGDLTLEVYANVDGTWKYYKAPAKTYSPNDFVTFNVDIDPRQGDLTVGIKIDDTEDLVEEEIKVPSAYAPGDAPVIVFSGFDGSRNLNFTEAVDYQGTQADFVVEAGIASCVLDITSDYLSAKGLPASVDLVTADESVKTQFSEYGIRWNGGLDGARIGSLDFSGLGKNIHDPENQFSASIKLTVTDKAGKKAVSEVYTLTQVPPQISVDIHDYNAFARRIEGLTANVPVGNPAAYELQYSADNSVWIPMPVKSMNGQNISYDVVSGLEPATEYSFRTVYNGNESSARSAGTLTTEQALQVGNSGFEDWTTSSFTYDATWPASDFTYNWYQPWTDASSAWWDVNSKVSMPSSGVGGVTNMHVKSCHTASYSTDSYEKSRSAHIYSVKVGSLAVDAGGSGTVYVGEIFIGKSDDKGNHSSDGHSFGSRPDAFSFFYKYQPVNDEKFYFKLELKSADGTVLYSVEESNGPSSSDWKKYEIPFNYGSINKKAASIFISFKSSSASNPSVNNASKLEVAGSDIKAHFGSSLRIDDLEMIYK